MWIDPQMSLEMMAAPTKTVIASYRDSGPEDPAKLHQILDSEKL